MAAKEAERRDAGAPPFGRLAALIVSARNEAQADAAAPAPLALLRGRHRRRLLAIAPRAFPLSRLIRDWVAAVPLPSTVRLQIDIDPQSFL